MKTIIILVLAAALVAGSFLSKPTQADFNTYINTQSQPAQPQAGTIKDLGKSILGGIIGDAVASTLVYHDHILWVTEDQNGKAQYWGAFSHWWKKGAASN